MESSQSEVFYCGEDVVICNGKPACISNLITLIPCYTLHRAPSNKSLSYTFSYFKSLSKMERELQSCLSLVAPS